MTLSRVPSEQLSFRSSKTGTHSLDSYMEDAEIGGLTLAELLGQIFDDDGVPFQTGLVDWKGSWTTSTAYSTGDTFSDPATGNIYVALTSHTSTTISADATAEKIALVINVQGILAAAQASADAAAISAASASGDADDAAASAAAAAASAAASDPSNWLVVGPLILS